MLLDLHDLFKTFLLVVNSGHHHASWHLRDFCLIVCNVFFFFVFFYNYKISVDAFKKSSINRKDVIVKYVINMINL